MKNRKLEKNILSKKSFLSRGKICFVSFFFLLFFIVTTESQVFSASCIPDDQNVSGCTFSTTQNGDCSGMYVERNYSLTCGANKVGLNRYYCLCRANVNIYRCDYDMTLKSTYNYLSSNITSNSFCTDNPGYWFDLSSVTKQIATDQSACNNWCRQRAIILTPTPTLSCPSVKAYCLSSSKVRVYWNGVSGAYSYKVYRDGAYKANVTTNGYTDTGLSCGIQHTYNVNPFPSGGTEKICKQNYKISCPCPTKAPPLKR